MKSFVFFAVKIATQCLPRNRLNGIDFDFEEEVMAADVGVRDGERKARMF